MPKTYESDPYLKIANSLDRKDRDRVCGTCQYHVYDDDGDWACANENGEAGGLITRYDDTCTEWEVRQ